jgi:hypothetical protein
VTGVQTCALPISPTAQGSHLYEMVRDRWHLIDISVRFHDCTLNETTFLAAWFLPHMNDHFSIIRLSRINFTVRLHFRIFKFSLLSSFASSPLRKIMKTWFRFDSEDFKIVNSKGAIIGDEELLEAILNENAEFEIEYHGNVQQVLQLDSGYEFVDGLDKTAEELRSRFSGEQFFQAGREVLDRNSVLLRSLIRGEPLLIKGRSPSRPRRGSMVRVSLNRTDEICLAIHLPGDDEITLFQFSPHDTIATVLNHAKKKFQDKSDSLYRLQILGSDEIVTENTVLSNLSPIPDLDLIEITFLSVTDANGKIHEFQVPIHYPFSFISNRFDDNIVSPFGMLIPTTLKFSEIISRHGTSFSIAHSFLRFTVIFLNDTSHIITMKSQSTIFDLRNVIAFESGDYFVTLLNSDGVLNDTMKLETVKGPFRCVSVKPNSGVVPLKPVYYDQLLSKLMHLSGLDIRTVMRCYNFHNYRYEDTLFDLTNL